MKIFNKCTKIIALMVVIIMATSAIFSCIPFGNNTTSDTSNPNQTSDTELDKPNPEPAPHTHVFGDWIIVKEATTTEDGLNERTCECGEVEQLVITASNKEYSVTYRNIKNADYPATNGYNSSEGLLTLPEITANGYMFVGWYTASIGGDLVDYIPVGSTGDLILFAHWELVEYEITYRDVPNVTNVTNYTIETSLKLTTPEWSGLEFSHWSDENGNKYYPEGNITSLPKQIFGDLVLTANWKVLRNIATPAVSNGKFMSAYSGENGYVYMIFELGTIEHVVLDNILPDMYYKYKGIPINLHLSQTISIGEETAQQVAKTVSHSVSNTSSFSHAATWTRENSFSENGSVSSVVSSSIGAKDLAQISASVESSMGYESSNSTSWASTTGRDSSSSSSSGTSESVSNSIAYKKDLTSAFSEDITISADLPEGYYAYVHATNVTVFGIVAYDITSGIYYINTYSRLDNMHSMMMYYANVNQLNNPSVEGLDFNLPEEKILNFVNSFYYVKYDANGGVGTMETSLHSKGGSEHLNPNMFTKAGHVFAGWELITEDGVKVLLDGQSVTNLGSPREIVTIRALWMEDASAEPTVTTIIKTGLLMSEPNTTYKAEIQYRNRTADSVEVRIIWSATKHWGYNHYKQLFYFHLLENDKIDSGGIIVAEANSWADGEATITATTRWVEIPLKTTNTTAITLHVAHWQENYNDVWVNSPFSADWTINIPAYH